MGRKAASKPEPGTPADKLGRLIKKKRPKATHSEIAADAGMHASKISQVLTGRIANPGVLTVQKILDAIGANFCDYHRA